MPTKDRPANLAKASYENPSSFVQNASASEDHNGRDVLTTAMMRALLLQAISIGVGSAREIVRRANSDAAYCWIVGEETVEKQMSSRYATGGGTSVASSDGAFDSSTSGSFVSCATPRRSRHPNNAAGPAMHVLNVSNCQMQRE